MACEAMSDRRGEENVGGGGDVEDCLVGGEERKVNRWW